MTENNPPRIVAISMPNPKNSFFFSSLLLASSTFKEEKEV